MSAVPSPAFTAAIGGRPPLSSSSSSSASSSSSHCSRCSSTQPSSDSSPEAQTASLTESRHRFLTRADVDASFDAHDGLLGAAKEFRLACMAKANASVALAGALDSCSRVKGANQSGPGLQAAAGFHYVLASTERVVADRLYKTFEIPLLETRDAYHAATVERSTVYAQALAVRTKKINETEEDRLRPPLSRTGSGVKKGAAGSSGFRDLGMLKDTLRILQEQIDELERIKGNYCDEVLDAEQDLWSTVLSRTGTVLRAELSSTTTLNAKAEDPVIAQVLLASPDPYLEDYDAQNPRGAGSVLTSLAPLPPSGGPSTNGSPAASGPNTPKALTTPLPESREASLFGAADDHLDQEVEALLSPRMSHGDPNLAETHKLCSEEAKPKRAQYALSDSAVAAHDVSDSDTPSSDSSCDELDGDITISPGSRQRQTRKSWPFPSPAIEVSTIVGSITADPDASAGFDAEAPIAT